MQIDIAGRRTFSMSDLTQWSGATGPQVEHWVRQGLIIPLRASTGRGSERVFSLQNVIEAAIARQLTEAGIAVKPMQGVFSQLRNRLTQLPPTLRASGTFVRYVEMVEAIVTINGPGPHYDQWRKDVTAIMQSWKKKQAPLDDRIVQILAAARAAEQTAQQKHTR